MISRLALGTASFGMAYPPGSSSPRPTHEESLEMLRYAYSRGVRWFDTATSYGSEHAVVSMRWPHGAWRPRISTKVWPELVEGETDWVDFYGEQLLECVIDDVLLHNPNIEQIRSCAGHWPVNGASVYAPGKPNAALAEWPAHAAIAAGLRVIQIPYHALDQSHARAGVFEAAKAAGVMVMARQPWGRGLLLLTPPELTDATRASFKRDEAKRAELLVGRFHIICGRHRLSYVEAGLRFSLESPADVVVMGVSSMAQLQQNLDIAASGPPPVWAACYAELLDTFKDASLTLASVCSVGR